MYQPPHHVEDRIEVMHALIGAHPLGLLISVGSDGPTANAIPFLLDTDIGPKGRLRCHLARANSQWREIAANPDKPVLIVFQGPNVYVSPSMYATKRETGKVVPTWNYAMVQARGTARVVDDRDWIANQISDLTQSHEQGRQPEEWKVTDAPAPFIDAQIKGIIGLEIAIMDLQGKWKVSQNRPLADRAGVVAGLMGSAPKMAGLVRRYSDEREMKSGK